MTTYQAALGLGIFAYMAGIMALVLAHDDDGGKVRFSFLGVVQVMAIMILPALVTGGIAALMRGGEPLLAIIVASWGYCLSLKISKRWLDKITTHMPAPVSSSS